MRHERIEAQEAILEHAPHDGADVRYAGQLPARHADAEAQVGLRGVPQIELHALQTRGQLDPRQMELAAALRRRKQLWSVAFVQELEGDPHGALRVRL